MSKTKQRREATLYHHREMYLLGRKYGEGRLRDGKYRGLLATKYGWNQFELGRKHALREKKTPTKFGLLTLFNFIKRIFKGKRNG